MAGLALPAISYTDLLKNQESMLLNALVGTRSRCVREEGGGGGVGEGQEGVRRWARILKVQASSDVVSPAIERRALGVPMTAPHDMDSSSHQGHPTHRPVVLIRQVPSADVKVQAAEWVRSSCAVLRQRESVARRSRRKGGHHRGWRELDAPAVTSSAARRRLLKYSMDIRHIWLVPYMVTCRVC